jgi:hypothetical protein
MAGETMSEPEEITRSRRFWGWCLFCVLISPIVLVVLSITTTPFTGSRGPSKTSGIFYNLRNLYSAQGQWALENHLASSEQVTKEAITPYMLRGDWIKPVAGEIYILKTAKELPEAVLTRETDGRPSGTVFRLGTNAEEIILLPNQHH